jgi:hypothetical protein
MLSAAKHLGALHDKPFAELYAECHECAQGHIG